MYRFIVRILLANANIKLLFKTTDILIDHLTIYYSSSLAFC